MYLINTDSSISVKYIEFVKEFYNRNEISDSEIANFSKRYPKTKISNIPVSWIILLDSMMSELYSSGIYPRELYQRGGFLVIDGDNVDKSVDFIRLIESEIYQMDSDLYKMLED